MTPAEIEKTKLVANALDRASTACFTEGIATPLAGYVYNFSGFRSTIGTAELLVGIIGWLVAAGVLDLLARLMLNRLQP